MESKTWVKSAHIIVFFLLVTSFETLMARKESDGLQLIKLPNELKFVDESDSNLFCPGKQRWPELIGISSQQAKEVIAKENPFIKDIPITLIGSPGSADFKCFRVRIIVNIVGVVVQIPVVG